MKSKHAIIAIILLSTLIAYSFKQTELVHSYDNQRSPCDAPLISAGWTGAPGDGSCASSGCHSGGINNGPGGPFLLIGNGDNLYVPGETYLISLGLTQELSNKFGFQITNRIGDINQFTGTNSLTDPGRTRLIAGGEYVGSNACGSDADPSGMITWDFEWTAPTEDQGEINFYANFIATNHDHSASGDNVYAMEISLMPDGATGILNLNEDDLLIFPNPARDHINISGLGEGDIVEIFNIHGDRVMNNVSNENLDISILKPGLYIMYVNSNKDLSVTNFVKIN